MISPRAILVTFVAASAVAASAFGKPPPVGIVNLCSGQITPQNTINDLAKHPWSSPNATGMRVKTQWNYVQPNNGDTYDWTGLDEAVRLGGVNHKFIGLSVMAGTTTPQWVYDAGAVKYTFSDGTGSMPPPWDPVFQSKWISFVKAMGARYDGNPAVGYVVIGGASQHFETYIAKVEPDVTNLTNMGGPSAWEAAAKKIIAVYAEAFPTTPFFLTLAKPFPNSDGVTALKNVTDWAAATYPGKFGIMNASLNCNSTTGYYPNEAVYTYRNKQPTGFQMLWSYYADKGARIGGTLDQALKAGVSLGGKFVEVYEPDVEDPSQQTVLATEGAALKGNLVQPPSNLKIM